MENPTLYIAKQLLKQIDEQTPDASFWLFSSVNRILKINEKCTLLEFYEILKNENQETFQLFKEINFEKGLKIIE